MLEFYEALEIPWYARNTAWMRYLVSAERLEEALNGLRRVAACLDWGEPPGTPCDCERCRRRAVVGVHHTLEESQRLGIVGCDRTDMVFDPAAVELS